jgi:hypothetical protein
MSASEIGDSALKRGETIPNLLRSIQARGWLGDFPNWSGRKVGDDDAGFQRFIERRSDLFV